MNVPSEFLIPAGGLLVAWLGYLAGQRKAASEDGKQSGVLLTEVGYIKSSVDDLKAEVREQRQDASHDRERLAKVEASAKQAHHRLDEMAVQLNRIDNKE